MNSRGSCRMSCWIAVGTLLCLGHDAMLGQINYTFADAQTVYGIGKSYTMAEVAGPATVNVGTPSGSSQLWDFSGFSYKDRSVLTGIAVSSGTGAANFPTANTCVRIDSLAGTSQTLSAFYFYNLSSASFSFMGMTDAAGLVLTRFTPAWPHIQFPCTLGSTWPYASTPESTQVSPGVVMTTYRNCTYTVDAFGTLRLPQGDFSALRIKEVQLHTTKIPPHVAYSVKTITYSYVTKEGAGVTVAVDSTQENLSTVTVSGGFTYTRPGRATAVEGNRDSAPEQFRLEQNYPNPFNPKTVIRYHLPAMPAGRQAGQAGVPGISSVRLVVYDLLGREVTTLVDEMTQAGTHEVSFDGTHLASGVYIYRLTAGAYSQSRTMLLAK